MLSIDRFQERTRALGPEVRSVVWFHGCSRNCRGCIAADMNRSSDYEITSPVDLAERVCSVEGTEGLTLSGGEPFEQDVASLVEFIKAVRHRSSLGVMVYTGYRLEELLHDAVRAQVLPLIDVLVDGPYVEAEDHGELWRGSANQRIHFLSDRYREIEGEICGKFGRRLEFSFQSGLQFSFTGIPPKGFKKNLERTLNEKGFEINWQPLEEMT